jgi:phage terminase large subunit
MARSAGWRVRIVQKLGVADGINAARTVFHTMWFDQARCADGIQALRYYRYDVDADTGQFSKQPADDHASHASDALRYVVVAMQGLRRARYIDAPKPPKLLPGMRTGHE